LVKVGLHLALALILEFTEQVKQVKNDIIAVNSALQVTLNVVGLME
jgi:hypothetical protein